MYSEARFSLLTLLLVVGVAFGPMMACASSTNITTEPTGAQVRIDGIVVGNSPVLYSEDSVWVWTKHAVTVEKEGYNTLTAQMSAQFIPLNLILGGIGFFLCLFPGIFALVGEYKPQYHYVLTQKESAQLAGGLDEAATIDFAE